MLSSGLRVIAVVNPGAGRGRAGRLAEPVLAALRSRGAAVRTVSVRTVDETAVLLTGPATRGADAVVAVGGAATAHLALQAAAALAVPLGLVAAGETPPLGASVLVDPHPMVAATATRRRPARSPPRRHGGHRGGRPPGPAPDSAGCGRRGDAGRPAERTAGRPGGCTGARGRWSAGRSRPVA